MFLPGYAGYETAVSPDTKTGWEFTQSRLNGSRVYVYCVPLRAVVERLVDLQRYGQQVAERGGPDGTTVVVVVDVVVAEVAALRGDAEAAAVSGAAR